jgi:hypothetical protein
VFLITNISKKECVPTDSSILTLLHKKSHQANNKMTYEGYKLKMASFTEECNTLFELFKYSEAQVLLEILKSQESIEPTDIAELKDFHNKVTGLLVMLNDQNKEEFWRFVENNKEILNLFPSKPVISSKSISCSAVEIHLSKQYAMLSIQSYKQPQRL